MGKMGFRITWTLLYRQQRPPRVSHRLLPTRRYACSHVLPECDTSADRTPHCITHCVTHCCTHLCTHHVPHYDTHGSSYSEPDVWTNHQAYKHADGNANCESHPIPDISSYSLPDSLPADQNSHCDANGSSNGEPDSALPYTILASYSYAVTSETSPPQVPGDQLTGSITANPSKWSLAWSEGMEASGVTGTTQPDGFNEISSTSR
ncbi:hypothetical protein TrRE_jg5205 [Triparma retinervis]|uniref:Uncharacterized protein n=1 Tax=Triparma retinervis TaxID=2557542 RepID=A0A9W7FFK5_9STRA|nr:hypothetical protein TrRE_jg5205 [Triparma retinervis]